MIAEIEYAYGLRNKHTFKCKAIKVWAEKHFNPAHVWLDPFLGESPFEVKYSNDIGLSGIDSHDWIKLFSANSIDGVFFDPPYSLERIKRSYKRAGLEEWQKAHKNQSGTYPKLKDEIARIIKPGGLVLSFGWSSVGLGSGRGFQKEKVLLVCHSGASRDTICVKERKIK